METKTCTKCGEGKELLAFQKSAQTPGGRNRWCRSCLNAYSASYLATEAGKAKRANSLFLRKYGITYDRYCELLEEQEGVCAICRCPETALSNKGDRVKVLAVDHDHSTGEVRGLLCQRCNIGIGHLDSEDLLVAAAFYVINALQHETATSPL